MKSPTTRNVTSSPESADGASPLNSLDGPHLDLFGQDLAPASHSAAQAKAKEEAMIATSGPSFVGLSPSSILSESLGSRLRKRLASTGSMEYRQTWKRMATRSGRLYWAHTASGHRTSANGYTGWPTVSTEDHKTDGPVVMAKIEDAIANGQPIPTTCQQLRNFAQLAGWTSPRSSDPKSGHNCTENMTGKSLPMDASLCGWATPRAEDAESCGMRHSQGGGRHAIGASWARFEVVHCRDGKARRFEPGSFPLAHGVPGRVGLLRGYGNAIVPQVAAEFIQAFLETTTTHQP